MVAEIVVAEITASEIMVMLDDDGQHIWHRQASQLTMLGQIVGQDWTAQHTQLQQQYPHLPWRLLLHGQDLQFQIHDVPKIRGQALQQVLKRKLAEWLPAMDSAAPLMANLVRLHPVHGVRVEERYGLCHLPAGHALYAFIDQLIASGIRLIGVHLISHALYPLVFNSLPPDQAGHVLLVTDWKQQLHLHYWQQQGLYLSRTVTVPANSQRETVLQQALVETRSYLLAQQWLPAAAQLQIQYLRYHELTATPITDVMTSMPEVKVSTNDTHADAALECPIWLSQLLKSNTQAWPNLATPQQMQVQHRYQIDRLVIRLMLLWCLSGLGWSWWSMQQIASMQQQVDTISKQNRSAAQSISTGARRIPDRLWQQALTFADYTQYQRLPDRLWHMLAMVQQQQPCWQLEHIRWHTQPDAAHNWQEQADLQYAYTCPVDADTAASDRLLAIWQSLPDVKAVTLLQIPASLPAQGDSSQLPDIVAEQRHLQLTLKPPVMQREAEKS